MSRMRDLFKKAAPRKGSFDINAAIREVIKHKLDIRFWKELSQPPSFTYHHDDFRRRRRFDQASHRAALYNLVRGGKLPDCFAIIGIDHTDNTTEGWCQRLTEMTSGRAERSTSRLCHGSSVACSSAAPRSSGSRRMLGGG
jgi:hypothetical protein